MNYVVQLFDGLIAPENLPVVLFLVWLTLRLEWTRSDAAKAHDGIGKRIDAVESRFSSVEGRIQSIEEHLRAG